MKFKKDSIADRMNLHAKYSVQCKKCGRKRAFYPFLKEDFKICDWCGNRIYKNEELEKEYKMMVFKKNLLKEMEK